MKNMMTLLILLSMNTSFAYEDRISGQTLEQYCNDDPSGEIFSELTDAYDTETQFDIVGLDWANYQDLDLDRDYSIYDFAQMYSKVENAIEYWEDKTCQTRGRDLFERSKR